mmetsp:Transcript_64581/g.185751  ORF Transcript_64581/g.185751 Transcript_64581/m.185751 type:complete len:267 (+) Transcript_64581:420-1220(+)
MRGDRRLLVSGTAARDDDSWSLASKRAECKRRWSLLGEKLADTERRPATSEGACRGVGCRNPKSTDSDRHDGGTERCATNGACKPGPAAAECPTGADDDDVGGNSLALKEGLKCCSGGTGSVCCSCGRRPPAPPWKPALGELAGGRLRPRGLSRRPPFRSASSSSRALRRSACNSTSLWRTAANWLIHFAQSAATRALFSATSVATSMFPFRSISAALTTSRSSLFSPASSSRARPASPVPPLTLCMSEVSCSCKAPTSCIRPQCS